MNKAAAFEKAPKNMTSLKRFIKEWGQIGQMVISQIVELDKEDTEAKATR
jgi:hypothetical protein